MRSRGELRHSSRGTALLAIYVLAGGLLGGVVGSVEAPRRPAAATTASPGYVSSTDDHNPDDGDDENHDALVVWPLVGLAAGAIVGSGAAELHLELRRLLAEE